MLRMENPGENSLPGPQFSSSQIRRKIVEKKVLSQHFYRNALTATNTKTTNTTIFLSNISKLKYNQIIKIQTQKHNSKINQIITIKAKKKKKRRRRIQKTEDRSHLTHLDCIGDEDERWIRLGQLLWDEDDPFGLRWGRLFWNQVKKKKQRERAREKK